MVRPIRQIEDTGTPLLTQHQWRAIRLGRVCDICQTVQASNEIDDTTVCKGKSLDPTLGRDHTSR